MDTSRPVTPPPDYNSVILAELEQHRNRITTEKTQLESQRAQGAIPKQRMLPLNPADTDESRKLRF